MGKFTPAKLGKTKPVLTTEALAKNLIGRHSMSCMNPRKALIRAASSTTIAAFTSILLVVDLRCKPTERLRGNQIRGRRGCARRQVWPTARVSIACGDSVGSEPHRVAS